MTILQQWDELPQHAASPNVAKRTVAGLGASLVQVAVKAGTKSDRHSHPHEQFVQVLEGNGVLATEEGRKPFTAGSLFHFPAGAWHEAEFHEDTILVETNLQAP